jgi:hypothetical protein
MTIHLTGDIKPISYIQTTAAEMMRYVNERKNAQIALTNRVAPAGAYAGAASASFNF